MLPSLRDYESNAEQQTQPNREAMPGCSPMRERGVSCHQKLSRETAADLWHMPFLLCISYNTHPQTNI